MEASLVPDLKLIGELEREIEREKNLLENEEAQLINLTKNAAREESSRKTQMKKVVSQLVIGIDFRCMLCYGRMSRRRVLCWILIWCRNRWCLVMMSLPIKRSEAC
jgi:hypothetical protein